MRNLKYAKYSIYLWTIFILCLCDALTYGPKNKYFRNLFNVSKSLNWSFSELVTFFCIKLFTPELQLATRTLPSSQAAAAALTRPSAQPWPLLGLGSCDPELTPAAGTTGTPPHPLAFGFRIQWVTFISFTGCQPIWKRMTWMSRPHSKRCFPCGTVFPCAWQSRANHLANRVSAHTWARREAWIQCLDVSVNSGEAHDVSHYIRICHFTRRCVTAFQ